MQEENKLALHFQICGDDFSMAGEASGAVKQVLKQIGIDPEIIRKVAVSLYEGEINMVIHANGGTMDVTITPEEICIALKDNGPGIPDVELAMREGYSTASDDVRTMGFGAGMGLPNMKRNTDKLQITTELGKGTTVEMMIRAK